VQAAARALKNKFPHVLIEGSGGIRLETITAFVCDEVDILSIGALTQAITPLDFSLKIRKN
jgi:nicotinate-nucleotide pyrophosphorylase (carboxylating)